MKQILPFKKEVLFKTKVSEITSISLEHTLSLKEDDLISGEFIITGDYKMTEGSINREKFQFKLPFDIALDSRYDVDSIIIDIDNFYYEIINNESLLVNIDVYVEGQKKEEVIIKKEIDNILTPIKDTSPKKDNDTNENLIEEAQEEIKVATVIEERNIKDDTLFKEEYTPEVDMTIPPKILLEDTNKESIDFNIFDNIDATETYVTYYVYIVKENDTLDKILEKYNVTKESVAYYNNLDNLVPGTKLIIPAESNE